MSLAACRTCHIDARCDIESRFFCDLGIASMFAKGTRADETLFWRCRQKEVIATPACGKKKPAALATDTVLLFFRKQKKRTKNRIGRMVVPCLDRPKLIKIIWYKKRHMRVLMMPICLLPTTRPTPNKKKDKRKEDKKSPQEHCDPPSVREKKGLNHSDHARQGKEARNVHFDQAPV